MAQDWIRLDCNFAAHPKVRRLQRLLDNPLADAYAVRLMLWCRNYSPDGDLSGFSPEEIEDAIGWSGDPGVLFDALRAAGFVDVGEDGLSELHGFGERQGTEQRSKEQAAERQRRFRDRHARSVPEPKRDVADAVTPVTPLRNARPVTPTDVRTDVTDGRTKDVSAETEPPVSPPAEPPSPPLLVFPTDGKPREWALRREQVDEWATVYTSLDVLAECRAALAWVRADAGRRKTPGGMARFLVGWLNRATNNRRSAAPAADTRRNPHPVHPENQAAYDRYEAELAATGTARLGAARLQGGAA